MTRQYWKDDVEHVFEGNVVFGGTVSGMQRSYLARESETEIVLEPEGWKKHNDPSANLPASSASADLAILGTTYGTDAIYIGAGDVKQVSITRYARRSVRLPPEYEAGQTVKIRVRAGMITNEADTSCSVDLEVRKIDENTGVGSDLQTLAAQDMNSTTFADFDFTVTPTTLAPGDLLDVRLTIASVDSATGDPVDPAVAKTTLLVDTRG